MIASCSRVVRSYSIACRIASNRSSSSNGLVRNSTAPAFIARTDVGTSAWPVMKITGIWISFLISSLWRSKPLSPGKATSKTRQACRSCGFESRKSLAETKVWTRHPAERSRLSIAPRRDASSSTTYTTESSWFIRYHSRQMKGCTREAADNRALESMWQDACTANSAGYYMSEFSHLGLIRDVRPRTRGCEECLKMGVLWVHLRLCLTCGHVGCCDTSKNRHATKHFRQTQHPIMRSFEPGAGWGWGCV